MAAFLLPWRITRYLHDVDTVVGSASRSIFLCSAAPCPAAEPSTASLVEMGWGAPGPWQFSRPLLPVEEEKEAPRTTRGVGLL